MQRYTITMVRNGVEVYVNLISSTAGARLNRQPYLLRLIEESLKSHQLKGPEVTIEQDMDRLIGNTNIVETSDKDTIFYAQAHKKANFSRYVKNRYLAPSRYITVLLERDDKGDYEVKDVWIGQFAPPFPGDEQETDLSKSYWENHALVMDTNDIQSKTITKICPY